MTAWLLCYITTLDDTKSCQLVPILLRKLILNILETELLSVASAGETSIDIGFNPDPRIGPYELWATSKKTGKYTEWCDKDRRRCQMNNMHPGVNYMVSLVFCYGSLPRHCSFQAKKLTVSTKPKCTSNTHFVRIVELTYPNICRIFCSSCASQCNS